MAGLIPRGYRKRLTDNYLHPKVEWIIIRGSPSLSGSDATPSNEDSESKVAVHSQHGELDTQEAPRPEEICCLRPKFEEDAQLILELCSSNLCSDVFTSLLENANPGLRHIEITRNTVLFHFEAKNNLNPVYPSLRLNNSNKNVIDLKRVCCYEGANGYIDKRINNHMKQKAHGVVMHLPMDLAAIESAFDAEVFTQNKPAKTPPPRAATASLPMASIESNTAPEDDVTPQLQDRESNFPGYMI